MRNNIKRWLAAALAAVLLAGLTVAWAAGTGSSIVDNLDSEELEYAGRWSHTEWSDSGYYAGYVSAAGEDGASVSLTFQGTNVELYGLKNSSGAECEIEIDGAAAGSASFYADTVQKQAKIFASETLAPGEHTIKVIKKADGASEKKILVDFFRYIASDGGQAGTTGNEDGLLTYSDVTGAKADEAASMLVALGIMTDLGGGRFGASYSVNCADFDAMAEQLGYAPKERTAPDSKMTVREAAMIVLDLLGYGDKARAMNQTGAYITVASQIGLRGVSAEEYLTKEKAAQMLYSALTIPVATPEIRSEGLYYTGKDGDTLLSSRLKLNRITGRMTANQYTALTNPDVRAGKNAVEIGDTVYYTRNPAVHELIGCNVICFTDEENQLAAAYAPEGSNDRVVVNADDIISAGAGSVRYEDENGREEKISFSGDTDVLYNKKALLRGLTEQDLTPEEGRLTFLDSDRNGRYDVLIIDAPEIFVVDTASSLGENIYLKNNAAPIALKDTDYTIEKDGKSAAITDLAAYDVISVLSVPIAGADTVVTISVSNAKTSGTVEEISGEDRIVVNGREYKILESCRDEVLEAASLGESVTLYLTAYGKVAACAKGADGTAKQFGCVIALDMPQGLQANSMLKIFDMTGNTTVYKVADKVRVNGQSYDSLTIGNAPALGIVDENLQVKHQLIQYELNSDGEINQIEVAQLIPEPTENDQNIFRVKYEKLTPRRYYGYTGMHFENELYINGDCKVIAVPSDDEMDNEKKYKILNVSTLTHNIDYNINVYNETDYGTADIILIQTAAADAPQTDMYQFDKVTTTIDEDGNAALKIFAKGESGDVTLVSTEGDEMTDNVRGLQKGDIFRVISDKAGMYTDVKEVYDRETMKIQPGFTLEPGEVWYAGEVITFKNNMLKIRENSGRIVSFRIAGSSTRSYYSADSDKLLSVKASDIEPGMRVFVYEKDAISIRSLCIFGN